MSWELASQIFDGMRCKIDDPPDNLPDEHKRECHKNNGAIQDKPEKIKKVCGAPYHVPQKHEHKGHSQKEFFKDRHEPEKMFVIETDKSLQAANGAPNNGGKKNDGAKN